MLRFVPAKARKDTWHAREFQLRSRVVALTETGWRGPAAGIHYSLDPSRAATGPELLDALRVALPRCEAPLDAVRAVYAFAQRPAPHGMEAGAGFAPDLFKGIAELFRRVLPEAAQALEQPFAATWVRVAVLVGDLYEPPAEVGHRTSGLLGRDADRPQAPPARVKLRTLRAGARNRGAASAAGSDE